MTRRTTRAELDTAAAAAVARALGLLGYRYDPEARLLRTSHGSAELRIIGTAVVSAPLRANLTPVDDENLVIVADVIVADARDALDQIGVGWRDRRRHIRLPFPGVEIDTDLDPLPRCRSTAATDVSTAVRGRAGLAVALETLIAAAERRSPDTAGGIARTAGTARQVAYRAVDQMRSAYLIGDDGRRSSQSCSGRPQGAGDRNGCRYRACPNQATWTSRSPKRVPGSPPNPARSSCSQPIGHVSSTCRPLTTSPA